MRTKLTICLILFNWMAGAQLKPFYSAENDKYGYRDGCGKVIVFPKYDLAWNFSDGMSPMKTGGKFGYVNNQGIEVISPQFDSAWMFSDGLSVVKVGDKYGFIDKKGKLVVAAIYDRADNFHGDRANVYLNGKWSVMIYRVKN